MSMIDDILPKDEQERTRKAHDLMRKVRADYEVFCRAFEKAGESIPDGVRTAATGLAQAIDDLGVIVGLTFNERLKD